MVSDVTATSSGTEADLWYERSGTSGTLYLHFGNAVFAGSLGGQGVTDVMGMADA
ncbi:MAG: hypothetical protein ACRDZR_04315 [Acidimicrobiales bacterium]